MLDSEMLDISGGAPDEHVFARLSQTAPKAAAKFQLLCDQRDDAYGALQLVSDRKREAYEQLQACERALQSGVEYRNPSSTPAISFPPGYNPKLHGASHKDEKAYKPADPVERREAQLAEAQAEYNRLCVAEGTKAALWNIRGGPLQRVRRWLGHVPLDLQITDYRGQAKASVKRPGFDDVERAREKITKLKSIRHGVRSAPWPSTDSKRGARQQVEALRKRGTPHLMGFIEEPNHEEIEWPATRVNLKSAVTTASGFAAGNIVDALGLLAWLMPDQLLAALAREIDLLSDDEHALDEKTRTKREQELAVAILAAEREEEALIELAWSQGTDIGRRATADPRAVLGLADDLPAPRED